MLYCKHSRVRVAAGGEKPVPKDIANCVDRGFDCCGGLAPSCQTRENMARQIAKGECIVSVDAPENPECEHLVIVLCVRPGRLAPFVVQRRPVSNDDPVEARISLCDCLVSTFGNIAIVLVRALSVSF